MGALKGASGQVAPSAAEALGGGLGGPLLGQQKSTLLGEQPSPELGGAAAGGRLAPARLPIGEQPVAPALSDSPLKPAGTQTGSLTPVRPPIRVPEEEEKAARRLGDAFDVETEPEPQDDSRVRKLSDAADLFPATSPSTDETTSFGAAGAATQPTAEGFGISRPRSEGAEEIAQRRGPPGGGRLVRDSEEEGGQSRGPPGGGRLVRDGPRPEVGGPPQRSATGRLTCSADRLQRHSVPSANSARF